MPLSPSAWGKWKGAAPVFAALGDTTRLALVARLCAGGPRSIAGAGLVRHTRRGREHIWEFETDRLNEARQCLDEISLQWDSALERLRKYVEQ